MLCQSDFWVLQTKFSLKNFMYQIYFDRVNEEFLTNLSKNPNLYCQKTFMKFAKENLIV